VKSSAAVSALLLLFLAACSGAPDWHGAVETLPNGAVRVTNPASGIWTEQSAWRLVPELRLGVEEGDDPALFSSIAGLAVGDDGRIYVLDRQANELRIFDAGGRHVRTVGRTGAGPGEYSAANGLLWIADDSLLVVDQRGNRYSVLDRNGEFVRSAPRGLGFFGWAFTGGQHDGVVYEFSFVSDPDARDPAAWEASARPVFLATDLRRDAGPRAVADEDGTRSATGAADPPRAGLRTDTLRLPELSGPAFEAFSVRDARGAGMSMAVPFAPRPIYHLDPHGTVWFGRGHEFRLTHATLGGDTLMEILLDATPAPVTEAELAEWEAGPAPTRFREMGGRLDLHRIPRTRPHFDAIFDDDDGNLWVSVPAAPEQTVFAIFDPDGRFLGRLHIDGVQRVTYLPPVVRNDRLYLVGTDELDVQRVYVFAIQR
jgi:hypothetical protein